MTQGRCYTNLQHLQPTTYLQNLRSFFASVDECTLPQPVVSGAIPPQAKGPNQASKAFGTKLDENIKSKIWGFDTIQKDKAQIFWDTKGPKFRDF